MDHGPRFGGSISQRGGSRIGRLPPRMQARAAGWRGGFGRSSRRKPFSPGSSSTGSPSVVPMTPEDVDRWLTGNSVEDALAMQSPAPDDALVMGPPVKLEKKAA